MNLRKDEIRMKLKEAGSLFEELYAKSFSQKDSLADELSEFTDKILENKLPESISYFEA
ncbi:hypothetical protein D3C81_2322550 [compost metagenome]